MEGSAVLTMVVSSDCIKAECHNQSCQRGVRKFCHISTNRVLLFLRENAAADGRKRGTPPAWYERQELAHDKPPTMVIPSGCRNSVSPDNTNGSAPEQRASVVIIIGRKRNERARKMKLFRRQAAASLRFKRKIDHHNGVFFTMPINSMILSGQRLG